MRHAIAAIVVVLCLVVPVAAAAQPAAPEVILDNPSVRVTVRTFVPGTGSGRHQGVEAEVGVVTEGELLLESPTGRLVVRQGMAYWLPGLTPHDTRNEAGRPARLLEIFLKRCD